ncbi:MAG: M23 family metallopeptidase, partial [Blastochloris sp.]|nr:M23 family metallopeptidase [Blastochloris sp.]
MPLRWPGCFAGNSDDGCITPARGVIIDHGNGYRTLYWHMSVLQVETGELVGQGAQLGIAGASGCAFGPHLHFQVQYLGRDVDPYGWCGVRADPGRPIRLASAAPGCGPICPTHAARLRLLWWWSMIPRQAFCAAVHGSKASWAMAPARSMRPHARSTASVRPGSCAAWSIRLRWPSGSPTCRVLVATVCWPISPMCSMG